MNADDWLWLGYVVMTVLGAVVFYVEYKRKPKKLRREWIKNWKRLWGLSWLKN